MLDRAPQKVNELDAEQDAEQGAEQDPEQDAAQIHQVRHIGAKHRITNVLLQAYFT